MISIKTSVTWNLSNLILVFINRRKIAENRQLIYFFVDNMKAEIMQNEKLFTLAAQVYVAHYQKYTVLLLVYEKRRVEIALKDLNQIYRISTHTF